jgi:hypothetical protein
VLAGKLLETNMEKIFFLPPDVPSILLFSWLQIGILFYADPDANSLALIDIQ